MTWPTKEPIRYTIPIEPIPWKRAGRCGKKMYDMQRKLKLDYKLILSNQHHNQPPFQGPLQLDITFNMQMPLSTSPKKLERLRLSPHYLRPDIDNLVKFFLDAATDVLWKDDAIISRLIARKIYSREPSTTLYISAIDFNGEG